MQKAPINENEQERQKAVDRLGILDTAPDPRFDAFTKLAAKLFGAKISTISIIDHDREWFKSRYGTKASGGPRDISFCGHALYSDSVMIVEDALQSDIFRDNPYVASDPFVRFYAGVVLREKKTNLPVGVLCVKDDKPRKFGVSEVARLIDLGQKVEEELNKSIK